MATANANVKKVLSFLKDRSSADSHVVETWRDGNSWVRVWSDGFMEQGGLNTTGGANGSKVTFHRPFTTIVLNTHCSSRHPGGGEDGWDYVSSVTLSSAVFAHENGGWYWYVCGY